MRRRGVLAALAAAMLVVAAGACSTKEPTTNPSASGEPIVVGSTLALTGAFAATGIIHKIAGEAFVARLNASGGLLGRPVEWKVLDDASDTTKIATLLRAAHHPGQGGPDPRVRTPRRTSSPQWRSPSGMDSSCPTTPPCWRRS